MKVSLFSARFTGFYVRSRLCM